MASIYINGDTNEVSIGPDPVPGGTEISLDVQHVMRSMAYTSEADPLFFKWQAGEGTEQEWRAKREEIRGRYPYPEE